MPQFKKEFQFYLSVTALALAFSLYLRRSSRGSSLDQNQFFFKTTNHSNLPTTISPTFPMFLFSCFLQKFLKILRLPRSVALPTETLSVILPGKQT